MADIHDVNAAEDQVSTTLANLQAESRDVALVLSTKAVCEAITAASIRLDYAISCAVNNLRRI